MLLGICDDNKKDIGKATQAIKTNIHNGELRVKEYDPEELLIDIEEELFHCDILVLEIYFKSITYNGIDLANMINRSFPPCEIIFFSSHIEYSLRVYETRHCYYVWKQEVEKMLPVAINKALLELDDNAHRDVMPLVCDGHTVFIDKKEILYIEREDRKINVVTEEHKYTCYQSLVEIMKNFRDNMIRVHGGYIVNFNKVTGIRKNIIELSNNMKIPLGRTYEKAVRKKYREYWSRKIYIEKNK
ncbi:MAG: LytTR family DNA-binding domain-containing protein [Clostridium sp.]|nr:LytTR family DNA-binding domain-containing protein [Clostridium sp.]MCM1458814.1 LytTR family DNA-binding domain-containing protein [Bacteroides sp.]